jgi:hypothetical protein
MRTSVNHAIKFDIFAGCDREAASGILPLLKVNCRLLGCPEVHRPINTGAAAAA